MNPLILSASNVRKRFKPVTKVNGQVTFTTPGTVKWKCPEGVFSVCAALLGAGGNSSAGAYTGAGGNLRYMNDIPVVPGQEYDILVPGPIARSSNPAKAFNLSTNDPITGALKGVNGRPDNAFSSGQGGNAAGGGSNSYGFSLLTFAPVTVRPAGYNDVTNRAGSIPGGGAGSYYAGGTYPKYSASGGRGEVRIIWGPDRGFPDKKIGNL